MSKSAPVGPHVHELIRERWSPRVFADRSIPAEEAKSLLEAAQWAPSSYNAQPWAFFVATRDEPEAFERLLSCLVPFNQSWAKSASMLVITAARATFEHNGKPNAHAWHDVGLAIAQLTIQAQSLGLGVHQMAGIDVGKTRETLVVPEGWDPVTGVAIGYPADLESLPEEVRAKELGARERKPLSEIVFGGRWGEVSSIAVEVEE